MLKWFYLMQKQAQFPPQTLRMLPRKYAPSVRLFESRMESTLMTLSSATLLLILITPLATLKPNLPHFMRSADTPSLQ